MKQGDEAGGSDEQVVYRKMGSLGSGEATGCCFSA